MRPGPPPQVRCITDILPRKKRSALLFSLVCMFSNDHYHIADSAQFASWEGSTEKKNFTLSTMPYVNILIYMCQEYRRRTSAEAIFFADHIIKKQPLYMLFYLLRSHCGKFLFRKPLRHCFLSCFQQARIIHIDIFYCRFRFAALFPEKRHFHIYSHLFQDLVIDLGAIFNGKSCTALSKTACEVS